MLSRPLGWGRSTSRVPCLRLRAQGCTSDHLQAHAACMHAHKGGRTVSIFRLYGAAAQHVPEANTAPRPWVLCADALYSTRLPSGCAGGGGATQPTVHHSSSPGVCARLGNTHGPVRQEACPHHMGNE